MVAYLLVVFLVWRRLRFTKILYLLVTFLVDRCKRLPRIVRLTESTRQTRLIWSASAGLTLVLEARWRRCANRVDRLCPAENLWLVGALGCSPTLLRVLALVGLTPA